MIERIGREPTRTSALVLSGGIALGAYQAGAYEALEEAGDPPVSWLAGSSTGTINAAIIAGNPPGRRVERLRQFWDSAGTGSMSIATFWLDLVPSAGFWRRTNNWTNALQTHLFGRPGIFRPRLLRSIWTGTDSKPGLYDLAPLRGKLEKLIDFDRLNSGEVRLSVVATDIVTGERVVFDTRQGASIGPKHLLASGALLPLFAPVEVEGRLLGDGGLTSNVPADLVLNESTTDDLVCFVIDLFARRGSRPRSLTDALMRAEDIIFGSQTHQILEGQRREHRLRAMIGQLAARLPPDVRDDPQLAPALAESRVRAATVLHLTRAPSEEIGPDKTFDFSHATLAERWRAGVRDMQKALRTLKILPSGEMNSPGLAVHEI